MEKSLTHSLINTEEYKKALKMFNMLCDEVKDYNLHPSRYIVSNSYKLYAEFYGFAWSMDMATNNKLVD